MPVDRGALDAQLREIGEGERWWEQREFRELPYVLNPDERIRAITLGRMPGSRALRLRAAGAWLLVATDQRLLCLKHERFARRQIDVAWSQITRLHQSVGIRSFGITLWTPERRYRIRIPKGDALRFAAALESLVPRASEHHPGVALETRSWLPGAAALTALPPFRGGALAAGEYASREHVERLEASVERLQSELAGLQQQVAFLEALLEKRGAEELLSRTPAQP